MIQRDDMVTTTRQIFLSRTRQIFLSRKCVTGQIFLSRYRTNNFVITLSYIYSMLLKNYKVRTNGDFSLKKRVFLLRRIPKSSIVVRKTRCIENINLVVR